MAHSLNTIRTADKIVFVGKDGTIKEQGSWEELLAIKDGGFAKFVKLQGLGSTTVEVPTALSARVPEEVDGRPESNQAAASPPTSVAAARWRSAGIKIQASTRMKRGIEEQTTIPTNKRSHEAKKSIRKLVQIARSQGLPASQMAELVGGWDSLLLAIQKNERTRRGSRSISSASELGEESPTSFVHDTDHGQMRRSSETRPFERAQSV